MKGFIISVLVLVGLGFFVLVSYGTVATKIEAQIAAAEGGRDGVDAMLAKGDDQAFIDKYQPLLHRRWTLALFGQILDNDFFSQDAEAAVILYADTPLDHDPVYGKFLFERAMDLSERGSTEQRQESYQLYGRYMANFPNGKKFHQADNARTQLTIKYGVH